MDSNFPQLRIRENYRSDWLISSDETWLELDFYIEELKIAYEIQGRQHFEFVPFFHGKYENFKKRRRHDQDKRDLCYGRGVSIFEICTETDAEIAIKNLKELCCKNTNPKYSYSLSFEKPLPGWSKLSKSKRRKLVEIFGSEGKAKRALKEHRT